MFLAAAPYFQARFSSSEWILEHFQSAIISVSSVTNLGAVLLLTKLQQKASYPKRIIASFVLNIICFTLLALSTFLFRDIPAHVYFVFLLLMVFTASLATSFCQNGVFAYVTGFGVGKYTQAIMTGQAVAGVLPGIVQIISVLSVPKGQSDAGAGQESPTSAFAYFLTATGVSTLVLIAFLYLRKRRPDGPPKRVIDSVEGAEEDEHNERRVVGLMALFMKLKWLSLGVFLCFGATMTFPVFTQEILSVHKPGKSGRIFEPATFIPLAFLFWNSGDLIGRLSTIVGKLSLVHYPRTVFFISVARIGIVPFYLLCNIKGRGAVIESDVFYLVVVQFLFGLTNGFVGSTCMMGASEWVEPEEREAAGGFMSLMLVLGLTVGSLVSFVVIPTS